MRGRSSLHKLIADVPTGLPSARIDPIRIERVLNNLIENAIKYSPEGGEIKILVRQEGSNLLVSVFDRAGHFVRLNNRFDKSIYRQGWS
jgi:signal transduction histidine kinase